VDVDDFVGIVGIGTTYDIGAVPAVLVFEDGKNLAKKFGLVDACDVFKDFSWKK